MKKLLIPCLYLQQGKAVTGFGQKELFESGDVIELTKHYSNNGADELFIFDFSTSDAEHDIAIGKIKEICDAAEIPVIGAGNIKRMEDVKKLIYAGCAKVALNFSKESNVGLLEDVSKRFGREKMIVCVGCADEFLDHQKLIEEYASMVLCLDGFSEQLKAVSDITVITFTNFNSEAEIKKILKNSDSDGVCGDFVSSVNIDLMAFKYACRQEKIDVNTFESKLSWSEFKLNSDGMVPVIVQDYKTDEVLMLAYMNEEAFNTTLKTGKMTYWSRSRNELWTKGLTSGHFQYVKSLTLDCDNDTMLAKVSQIGAACHTGSRTCFFNELVKKECDDTNPLHVFQDVYDVILDRKENPKEGSYTNYLFDKGIDKILKKVGEECTEIVIAAKNPDKEEIKYEISDFLYHVMVLMAVKGVSWEDITKELARR